MNGPAAYPIGKLGKKWGPEEKAAWRASTSKKRSYEADVLPKIERLRATFDVEQYGVLSYDTTYPLFSVKTRNWNRDHPTALITGGVHGYETSGVHGALDFISQHGERYGQRFNILVAPCVSPWAYETINRWNPDAIDPNRSFVPGSPAGECAALMALLKKTGVECLVHMDLHETTDTDESEFRPALAARDGQTYTPGLVPDGFYVVGDTENRQESFHQAIISAVRQVTHIAPADEHGKIIGERATQAGVIYYPFQSLGLCAGVARARYACTTEVYPDSPQVTDRDCNRAQVAAVRAALDHVSATL